VPCKSNGVRALKASLIAAKLTPPATKDEAITPKSWLVATLTCNFVDAFGVTPIPTLPLVH